MNKRTEYHHARRFIGSVETRRPELLIVVKNHHKAHCLSTMGQCVSCFNECILGSCPICDASQNNGNKKGDSTL